ncbi:hypothetical protein P8C59_003149 [Phyllachora maydis]|uniref:Integrase catalytic domain-containing protein n=1 Tax=Phyllachora maydis TaxID=1825666 RepID=A0AAD9I0V9_9PEZI|nr:hypothetical protein P8C59_003149 [Phyllachora maydis]
MADQAKGKEDKEDGKDYSEVIEVLKQYIKSYKRVIAGQSSDIETLLLSLNTLKASVEDSVSAIKNISSTLASLTNSSNAVAATTGKTSYSPRFDPFSGTIDLDSPLRPPRKEPHLGPAVDNTATSNLDPPIDIGSKEGFKDTITSSIVKELSQKAYTIPDDSKLSGESNFEQTLPNSDINIVSGCNKIVVEIPSDSIRKEDYKPIIEDAIVSEAIEPKKRYKLRNSPAKGTTLEGAPYQSPRETREPKPLTGTGDMPCVLREPVIEGNKVEKAISSPTLKEPNIGQRDYYNLLNLAKLWHVRLGYIGLRLLKKTSSITKGLPDFDKIKEANFHCSSCDRGKAVRRLGKPHDFSFDRKSRYSWVFNLPNKLGPIVANAIKGFFRGLRNGFSRYPTKFHFDGGTEITDLLTTWLAKRGIKFSTSAPYIYEQNGLVERSVRVILDLNSIAITNKETTPFQALFNELEPEDNIVLSQPTNNTALEGELVDLDLDLEGAVSPDPSNLNTEKPISIEIGPSKLGPYESSSDKPIFAPKPIEVIAPNQSITNEPLNNSDLILEGDKMQLDSYKLLAKTSSYILAFVYKARKRVISKDKAITKEFIQLLELGVFKFLPRSLLPFNYKLITCRNVLKVKKDAKNRPIKYKSRIPPTWRILLAIGTVLD